MKRGPVESKQKAGEEACPYVLRRGATMESFDSVEGRRYWSVMVDKSGIHDGCSRKRRNKVCCAGSGPDKHQELMHGAGSTHAAGVTCTPVGAADAINPDADGTIADVDAPRSPDVVVVNTSTPDGAAPRSPEVVAVDAVSHDGAMSTVDVAADTPDVVVCEACSPVGVDVAGTPAVVAAALCPDAAAGSLETNVFEEESEICDFVIDDDDDAFHHHERPDDKRLQMLQTMKRTADECFGCLKSMLVNEKSTYFFEHVMCLLLDIDLIHGMKLVDFVKHVLRHNEMKCSLQPEADSSLHVLDRDIRAFRSGEYSTITKTLTKYRLDCGSNNCYVFQIRTRQGDCPNSEFLFYEAMKELVRGGDICGIPLLLSGGIKDKHTEYVIPDYGLNLQEFCDTYPSAEKDLIYLSVISVCSSLPAINDDMHSKNICVYMPDVKFRYIWTVQTSTHLIEFSWVHLGLITVIDWELFSGTGKKRSSSSATWSYRQDTWVLKLRENRILGIKRLDLIGESGIWTLMKIVLDKLTSGKVKTRFCRLPTEEANSVASKVEIVPNSLESDSFKIPNIYRNRWANRMSSLGNHFKLQRKLSIRDIQSVANLLDQFNHLQPTLTTPFCPIPSDTGLVTLTWEGELIAAQSIDKDTIVTMVTVTDRIQLFNQDTNPLLKIGMNFATVFRKVAPFVGFGSFATWESSKRTNCVLSIIRAAKNKQFALKATKPIRKGDLIVCDSELIINRKVHEPCEDRTLLSAEVKAQLEKTPVETRQTVDLTETDEDH